MDKWVIVGKSSTGRASNDDKKKKRTELRHSPYNIDKSKEKRFCEEKDYKHSENGLRAIRADPGSGRPSSVALNKHLLTTLSDESNPITHSDIYERSDHVVSIASGHQRSEKRGGLKADYLERSKKLNEQREERPREATLLSNVRVYINGYLSDTTDIEMKRIVCEAGGQIMYTAPGATHIVTSHESLNASKTHKFLNTKQRNKVYVVKPEWVTDSIKAGKRLSEGNYAVIKDTTMKNLFETFKTGST